MFHRIPYLPQLCIYYTPQTDRVVIGHFEGYFDKEGNLWHVVMFETDQNIEWKDLLTELHNTIGKGMLQYVFRTKRGFHVYTKLRFRTWEKWHGYLSKLCDRGIVDVGWLRLAEWRHDRDWLCWGILRLSQKYDFNDFRVYFYRVPLNTWYEFVYWSKVKGVKHAWKMYKYRFTSQS